MKYISALVIAVVISMPIAVVNAQIPELKEVKGRYINNELGIEITLPTGWSGAELMAGGVDFLMGGFFATPEGLDIDMDTPVMSMYIIDATKQDISTSVEPSDPSRPDCRLLSSSLVDISDAKGFEMIAECNIDGSLKKFKGLFISQEDERSLRGISVLFAAPINLYDEYVDDFDNSVRTLKIANMKSISLPLNNHKEESVIIDDTPINVKVLSNSAIKDFKFNKDDKSISLTVEGESSTIGIAEIYLGSVLRGPYTVMINGELVQYIPIRSDDGTEGIKIVYTHSVKEIEIIGTAVVPEFPLTVLPILAAVLGASIFIARSRFNI
jgi:hypothetical protein